MEEAKRAVKAFLDGTTEVAFRVSKDERNAFIVRMTGLSRQQDRRMPTNGFASR